jgi:hypothetical protein
VNTIIRIGYKFFRPEAVLAAVLDSGSGPRLARLVTAAGTVQFDGSDAAAVLAWMAGGGPQEPYCYTVHGLGTVIDLTPRSPGSPPAGRGEAYEGDVPVPPPPAPPAPPPPAPAEAPRAGLKAAPRAAAPAPAPLPRSSVDDKLPLTGKALYGWAKDMGGKHGFDLIKYLGSWAKLQEFPGRMVEWDAVQVAEAVAEVERKLTLVNGSS